MFPTLVGELNRAFQTVFYFITQKTLKEFLTRNLKGFNRIKFPDFWQCCTKQTEIHNSTLISLPFSLYVRQRPVRHDRKRQWAAVRLHERHLRSRCRCCRHPLYGPQNRRQSTTVHG